MDYTDRNGNTVKAGMLLRFEDGSIERVYETAGSSGETDLGINASNESYLRAHPEAQREYYSLSNFKSSTFEITD